MIRNRLASILADRGIKISRASMELPNLSRNTITNTASNSGKMIQLATIDTLCQYLNITPNEFFEYLPFDLEYQTDITRNDAYLVGEFSSFKIDPKGIEFDFYIKQTFTINKPSKLFQFNGVLTKFTGSKIFIELYEDDNNFKDIWNTELTSGFKPLVWDKIKSNISVALNDDMNSKFGQFNENDVGFFARHFADPNGSDISLKTGFNTDIDYITKKDNDVPF